MDSWYRHGLMVLTTPMVLTQTDGIVSVLLNHTRARGPSFTLMRDFWTKNYQLSAMEEVGNNFFTPFPGLTYQVNNNEL